MTRQTKRYLSLFFTTAIVLIGAFMLSINIIISNDYPISHQLPTGNRAVASPTDEDLPEAREIQVPQEAKPESVLSEFWNSFGKPFFTWVALITLAVIAAVLFIVYRALKPADTTANDEEIIDGNVEDEDELFSQLIKQPMKGTDTKEAGILAYASSDSSEDEAMEVESPNDSARGGDTKVVQEGGIASLFREEAAS